MIKYTLLSYLIFTIMMLYLANKMLEKKDILVQQVAGTYTKQINEIERMEAEINGYENYEETSTYYNLEEELKKLNY